MNRPRSSSPRRSRSRGPLQGFVARLAVAVLLAARGGALAEELGDIVVRFELEHDSVLKYEPLNAFLSIGNRTDYPLILGEDAADANVAVRFVLEHRPYQPVLRFNRGPILRRTGIELGDTRQFMVDLSRWYDVAAPGRYIVHAELVWRGRTYASKRVLFDIVPGIELKRVTRSVPGYPDIAWTYSLRYWNRTLKMGRAEYLFLSVDDEKEGLNYGLFLLGRLVRIHEPAIDVDRHGLITVAHQSGPDCYIRSVLAVSMSGVSMLDQTYHLPNGDPYPSAEGQGSQWSQLRVRDSGGGAAPALTRWWRRIIGTERRSSDAREGERRPAPGGGTDGDGPAKRY